MTPIPQYAKPIDFTQASRAAHRRYIARSRHDHRRNRARQLFVGLVFRACNERLSVERRVQYLTTARRVGAVAEGF